MGQKSGESCEGYFLTFICWVWVPQKGGELFFEKTQKLSFISLKRQSLRYIPPSRLGTKKGKYITECPRSLSTKCYSSSIFNFIK